MKILCGQCGKKFWPTDGHVPPKQRFCSKSCGAKHSVNLKKIKQK